MNPGDAWRALVHAARLDERSWRRLGDLMEQAGCAVDPAELRIAHPEFDGSLLGGTSEARRRPGGAADRA